MGGDFNYFKFFVLRWNYVVVNECIYWYKFNLVCVWMYVYKRVMCLYFIVNFIMKWLIISKENIIRGIWVFS